MTHPHIQLTAALIVAAAAAFLLLQAAAAFLAPRAAERFLESFASSARAHVIEQALRIIVGAALVVRSPLMRLAPAFEALGWLLIATSAALLLIPWRWHHRFARAVIPTIIRHMKLYGLAAGALGALILAALLLR